PSALDVAVRTRATPTTPRRGRRFFKLPGIVADRERRLRRRSPRNYARARHLAAQGTSVPIGLVAWSRSSPSHASELCVLGAVIAGRPTDPANRKVPDPARAVMVAPAIATGTTMDRSRKEDGQDLETSELPALIEVVIGDAIDDAGGDPGYVSIRASSLPNG